MGKVFTRKAILEQLRKTITKGEPIIGAGCSAGIIAKCAELGGADLIITYSTGKSRFMGLQTTVLPNSNNLTLGMFEEISRVVKKIPIIAGVEASDSSERSLNDLLMRFMNIGFSGIINFPTVGYIDPTSKLREEKGFPKEIELIRLAHENDVFTMAYVFYPCDAVAMALAGVDVLVPHVGGTAGGEAGFRSISHEKAVKKIQEIIKACEKVRSDLIFLGHGGPFAEPSDTDFLYRCTKCVGFVGASSIERIPIERAVKLTVMEFKSKRIRALGK
jgi:predicted TIM-barrel enzyme